MQYFQIQSLADGNQVKFTAVGSPTAVNLQYSLDGQAWNAYEVGNELTINNGDSVWFRNDTGTFSTNNNSYYKVETTQQFNASGDASTLLNYTVDQLESMPANSLNNLFKGSMVVDASQLALPSVMSTECFRGMFYECINLLEVPVLPSRSLAGSCYLQMFYGCSSLQSVDKNLLPATTLASRCYDGMFQRCSALKNAPNLPATVLATRCYNSMFNGCSQLAQAPKLPAETLTDQCYRYMFTECRSLTEVIELPAKTLVGSCYEYMFINCSRLNGIICGLTEFNTSGTVGWLTNVSPTGRFFYTSDSLDVDSISRDENGVPARWTIARYVDKISKFKHFTLAPDGIEESSHQYAFDGGIDVYGDASRLGDVNLEYRFIYDPDDEENGASTWLSYAPGAPVSQWRNEWFAVQFRNTTGQFSNNPNILGNNYYHIRSTFAYVAAGRITSLLDYRSDSPSIPAGAFYRLFNETLIQDASQLVLPGYVSQHCYTGMFRGCAQMKKAPELPAKELASSCYFYMFKNCNALTKVVLPATSGYADSYSQLFSGCTGINEIVFSYPQWPASPNVGIGWMLDSAPTGTFYYTNSSFDPTAVPRTTSGVPSGWQMAYLDNTPYLRLTSLEDDNVIALTMTGEPTSISLQYRTDLNLAWQMYDVGTELTLFKDSWIEFRNTTGTFSSSTSAYYKFASSKTFNVSGRIGSLLHYSLATITANVDFAFINLFNGAKIVDASELEMNLAKVGASQCQGMFQQCSSMTRAPELPAKELVGSSCYSAMFRNCTSLKKAPELPALKLYNFCYYQMFQFCYALTKAPRLRALFGVTYGYNQMFSDCTSLKIAEVDADSLDTNNSSGMFGGCTALEKIVFHGKTVNSSTFTNNVQTVGTFEYTNPNADPTTFARGTSGVPTSWEIKKVEAEKAGIKISVNGSPASKFMILRKAVKSMSIDGVPVKAGGAQYGTDIDIPYQKTLWTANTTINTNSKLDTGVIVSDHMKIGMKWVYPSKESPWSWPVMFGNGSTQGLTLDWTKCIALRFDTGAGTGQGLQLCHYLRSASNTSKHTQVICKWGPKAFSNDVHFTEISPTTWTVDDQTVDIVEYSNTVSQFDGVTDAVADPGQLTKNSILLFGDRTSGSRISAFRCCNFYIIDTITNEVLINLIPCAVDGVGMFYDTASKRLMYASNAYQAGPAV